MYKFAMVITHLSGITSIIGFIFAFINPSVTLVLAGFSLFASVMNVWFGDQNGFVTEIFTIIMGLLIGLVSEIPIAVAIGAAICFGDALISIIGWISLLVYTGKYR